MSYSDSHASSCSDDTWHERLYTDYEYLSEISDIHSNLSDMSGDSLHEYLFERYYKARNLIAKMRKETIIYLFIESLSKYTKKDYEFIKQYKHNLNQEIVKKYVNMFILKKICEYIIKKLTYKKIIDFFIYLIKERWLMMLK